MLVFNVHDKLGVLQAKYSTRSMMLEQTEELQTTSRAAGHMRSYVG